LYVARLQLEKWRKSMRPIVHNTRTPRDSTTSVCNLFSSNNKYMTPTYHVRLPQKPLPQLRKTAKLRAQQIITAELQGAAEKGVYDALILKRHVDTCRADLLAQGCTIQEPPQPRHGGLYYVVTIPEEEVTEKAEAAAANFNRVYEIAREKEAELEKKRQERKRKAQETAVEIPCKQIKS